MLVVPLFLCCGTNSQYTSYSYRFDYSGFFCQGVFFFSIIRRYNNGHGCGFLCMGSYTVVCSVVYLLGKLGEPGKKGGYTIHDRALSACCLCHSNMCCDVFLSLLLTSWNKSLVAVVYYDMVWYGMVGMGWDGMGWYDLIEYDAT